MEVLEQLADVPACQHLHFLQMACEKLCKAHLCGQGTDPVQLQHSHAYIAGTLHGIAREQFARLGGRRLKDHTTMLTQIRHLAREIELLAPTVDDGGRRPQNCEYPWEDALGVHVPAEYEFPNLDLLHGASGRLLLRLIPYAIEQIIAP
jgi:hypothetical protein